MKRYLFALIIFISLVNNVRSQKVIEMQKVNGIFQIPCKVNGIPMKFIFDTGASDVSISITEAKFLLKQGLLKKEDFIENVNYQIANGDIVEGTKINLKSIDIDGIVLNNIKATIIHQQNAPLLLGQSAISKLGKYSIIENKLIIEGSRLSKNDNFNSPKTDITEALNFLNSFFNNESWAMQAAGSFVYNDYLKSLAFKSKKVIKNSKSTSIEIEYVVNLDNIENIIQIIHKADESKVGDHNIIFFDLILKNEIFYKNYTQEIGDVIPNYKNEKVNKVSIMLEKSLTNDDLENLQTAIKDIFKGIPIDSKHL